MTTICIPNWDKWQSYRKDRGTPPWIKVHRSLLSSGKWAVLTDSEKGQIVSIWIVAADKGGIISSSPRVIQKICQLDDEPNINRFIELGFLTTMCQPCGSQPDNQTTTTRPQHDAPETETETETEKNIKHTAQNEFERWWSVYPKKVGKKPARAIWKRIKPDADLLIEDTTVKALGDDNWQRGYIPNPATYLNQERWNDELHKPKQSELTEADKYAISKRRTNAILQKINGSDVGRNDPALPSPMEANERRDWQ